MHGHGGNDRRTGGKARAAGPLAGVRVVDFSRYLPGPFCTLQLAWLGADVVTVEEPPTGDPIRHLPPLGADGESLAAASLMRGKHQRLIDLRTADGVGEAVALCADADVVVESFRPGVAERIGIGHETLSTGNPRLVYCSLSGYGQTGPWATRAGHDANYLATAGLLARCGPTERPVLPPVPLADLAGGALAATAICAALAARATSGRGTHIDMSLTEAALAWQAMSLPAAASPDGGRGGGFLTGGMACYDVYECADGRWIAVGAIEHKFFRTMCTLIGEEDLADLQFDMTRQDELRSRLAARFATRDAAGWHELLAEVDTCVTMLADGVDVATHPQLAARDAVIALDGNAHAPAPASPYVFDGVRTQAAPGVRA